MSQLIFDELLNSLCNGSLHNSRKSYKYLTSYRERLSTNQQFWSHFSERHAERHAPRQRRRQARDDARARHGPAALPQVRQDLPLRAHAAHAHGGQAHHLPRLQVRPLRHRGQVPQQPPLAHVAPAPRHLHQGPARGPHARALRPRPRLQAALQGGGEGVAHGAGGPRLAHCAAPQRPAEAGQQPRDAQPEPVPAAALAAPRPPQPLQPPGPRQARQ